MKAWKLNSLNLSPDLATPVASAVFIEGWTGPSVLDPGIEIPGRDGVDEDPLAPRGPWSFQLHVVFPWADQSGDDYVLEGRNKVLAELYRPDPMLYVTIGRGVGAVRTPVRLVADPFLGGDRNHYVFTLRSRLGGFQDVSASTASGTPPTVTTKGVRPITDPTIQFAAAGTYKHTWSSGRVFEITVDSGPTFPVTIDVGARSIVDDAAADAAGAVTFSDPEAWLMLEHASMISQTATSAVTLSWRNRW